MLETSARLLRLLTLLQSRRHWTGADLSERLEIDRRTVRRDVDRLRDLGYPVQASSGLGGGYQLGSGSEMPPVLLSDDEAVAVAVALRAAASSIGGIEETAVGLLAKLDQLLPSRLRKRIGALDSVVTSLPASGPRASASVLAELAAACRDHEAVELHYRDKKERESLRRVEPVHLVHSVRRWYLVAWDLGREDWRTFRVDRMRKPKALGSRFVPRELPEPLPVFISRSLTTGAHRYQLRVELKGSAVELAKTVPGWTGLLVPVGERRCHLHVGGETMDALAAHLIMCGQPFEILDQPAFLPELRTTMERLNRSMRPKRASR